MPKRECTTCRQLHSGPGPRCPAHTRARERARDQARGTAAQRGYDYEWQRKSAIVIKTIGHCVDCGHTGTPDNPLTCDHILPKHKGGTDAWSNLTCRCRQHNSSKGTRTT